MAAICSTNGAVHTPRAAEGTLLRSARRPHGSSKTTASAASRETSWPKHSSEERFLTSSKAFLSCPLLSQVSALCYVAQMAQCCMCTSTAVRFGVGYMELATLPFR